MTTSSAEVRVLDHGVVAFTGAGSCVIDAAQPGNSMWQPAPQVQQTISVAAVAPQNTVSGSGSFTVSKPGSVSFTGIGTPTPALSESGALPARLSFSAGADGQASISGTPKPGIAGSYEVLVSAVNVAGHARMKVIYLALRNISDQRGGDAGTGTHGWKNALNAFALQFPDRLPL